MDASGEAGDCHDGNATFIGDDDAIQTIVVDEEDLPSTDEEAAEDADMEGPDDSVHIFCAHDAEVLAVACSPTEAEIVATGGQDDRGFMWNIGQANWHVELHGHSDTVVCLAFSKDGMLLASGNLEGLIQVWDSSTGAHKGVLEGPGGSIEWLQWHPRGHLILAGSDDSTVWMWNADRCGFLNIFCGHSDSVTCGDFTPDGKMICTGSKDASLRIWNPRNKDASHVVRGYPYHTEGLTCLTITTDSTVVISGSRDGSVHMVNVGTGKVISSLVAHSDSVECIGLSGRFPLAATASVDQTLVVWDMHHSSPRCSCVHEDVITCLSWVGSSQYVATGCLDGKIRVWDCLSGCCVKLFHGHTDAIQAVAVTSNGKFVVSASDDGTARVFPLELSR